MMSVSDARAWSDRVKAGVRRFAAAMLIAFIGQAGAFVWLLFGWSPQWPRLVFLGAAILAAVLGIATLPPEAFAPRRRTRRETAAEGVAGAHDHSLLMLPRLLVLVLGGALGAVVALFLATRSTAAAAALAALALAACPLVRYIYYVTYSARRS